MSEEYGFRNRHDTNYHGNYSGVVDIARNGIDEIIHLREENKRLREGLKLITCESINAEYIAQNVIDGLPPYHDTMLKVGDDETANHSEDARDMVDPAA
jgi:hypothetical protein